MKEHQDAFGQILRGHLEGEDGPVIIERDDGFIDVSSGPEAYFTRYKEWPTHHRRAMRFARGRTLDIGCGAGRHSLHLQGKGLDVLGIDESPLAIEVCRRRGLQQARVMSISRVSSQIGMFDTILMLGCNFGLFGDFRKARRLLRRFHRLTGPQGRVIADSLDPYDTPEPAHLENHELNRNRGRMPGQARLRVRHKKYATPWFDYLFVSRDEMRLVLEGTGWAIKRLIDSDRPQYIAIIEKAKP